MRRCADNSGTRGICSGAKRGRSPASPEVRAGVRPSLALERHDTVADTGEKLGQVRHQRRLPLEDGFFSAARSLSVFARVMATTDSFEGRVTDSGQGTGSSPREQGLPEWHSPEGRDFAVPEVLPLTIAWPHAFPIWTDVRHVFRGREGSAEDDTVGPGAIGCRLRAPSSWTRRPSTHRDPSGYGL